MPSTPWIRSQCGSQFVRTGAQVSGPRSCVKLITGWKLAALLSLKPRLKPSNAMSPQP